MIDTHCHFDYAENPISYISNNERNKILTIGMTNLPSHFNMGIKHITNYRYIRLALGLHPLLASKHESEYAEFIECIDKTSYIGEIGLDFSKAGLATKDIQINSFDFILESLINKKKILSIHSRNAEIYVLSMLTDKNIDNAIFHWYSGSIKILKKIIERNYFFSINSSMVNSENGKKIISNIPENQMLTESDFPFINNTNIRKCEEYLSCLWKKSNADVESIIYSNFMRLIKNIQSN
ncbi:MAG: TatD family hydrolase [Bacteroidales bacterium]|jgi:TatD DNase family protein|nr:TatD family hydrolase [Bacteroidales bacterium]